MRVDAQADRVPAGVDGEAVHLQAPLDFRSLPGVLRVRMPPPSEARMDSRLLARATVRRLWTIARTGGGT